MLHIITAMHIGPKADQEDCILVAGRVIQEDDLVKPVESTFEDASGLFAVADGMGGLERGEWASRFVCERLAEKAVPETVEDADAILHELQTAIEGEGVKGSGTTVAGVALRDGRAVIFNAGDSRVYKRTGGVLRCLSHDHSLMQSMLDKGHLAPEDARDYRYRNVIEFGLGDAFAKAWRGGSFSCHFTDDALAPGEAYVICSDGVNDTLEDAEIAALLSPPSAKSVAALAGRLAEEANDNFALLIVAREE